MILATPTGTRADVAENVIKKLGELDHGGILRWIQRRLAVTDGTEAPRRGRR